jgi:hypothetical protein
MGEYLYLAVCLLAAVLMVAETINQKVREE